MKTRIRTPHPLLTLAVTTLAWTPLKAQVTIPSQSASSLEAGETTETTVPSAPSGQSAFQNQSNVSRNTLDGPTRLLPAAPPAPKPGSVTAIQRVDPPVQRVDPKRMERLAELRRALGIDEAATQARITLPADELFETTAPNQIDDLAEPTLKMLAEYIDLTDKKAITVRPFYVKDLAGAKSQAWTRSLSLIEWLSTHSSSGLENYKAVGPAPVDKATPKKFAQNSGETEFVGRIELHFE